MAGHVAARLGHLGVVLLWGVDGRGAFVEAVGVACWRGSVQAMLMEGQLWVVGTCKRLESILG